MEDLQFYDETIQSQIPQSQLSQPKFYSQDEQQQHQEEDIFVTDSISATPSANAAPPSVATMLVHCTFNIHQCVLDLQRLEHYDAGAVYSLSTAAGIRRVLRHVERCLGQHMTLVEEYNNNNNNNDNQVMVEKEGEPNAHVDCLSQQQEQQLQDDLRYLLWGFDSYNCNNNNNGDALLQLDLLALVLEQASDLFAQCHSYHKQAGTFMEFMDISASKNSLRRSLVDFQNHKHLQRIYLRLVSVRVSDRERLRQQSHSISFYVIHCSLLPTCWNFKSRIQISFWRTSKVWLPSRVF